MALVIPLGTRPPSRCHAVFCLWLCPAQFLSENPTPGVMWLESESTRMSSGLETLSSPEVWPAAVLGALVAPCDGGLFSAQLSGFHCVVVCCSVAGAALWQVLLHCSRCSLPGPTRGTKWLLWDCL